MTAPTLRRLLALVAVAASVLALLSLRPSASGTGAGFDVASALDRLARLAATPRPTGGSDIIEARVELIDELEAIGLEVEVQEGSAIAHALRSWFRGGRVTNVIARLPGRDDGPAVLLMAHLDSVPSSPGAADAGSSVVTLLQVARTLAAEAPLARDVIFLFSDGEEAGLLGARAFHDQHPLAERVGLVLNFEARGTSGPLIMFETAGANAALVERLHDLTPGVLATSLSREIYERMPNDTDFTIFNDVAGLNFAYIHGADAYHAATDTADRLSPATLQQIGDTALVMARYFADEAESLEPFGSGGDAIYFDLLGRSMPVAYGIGLALPLQLLALALLVAGWWRIARRRQPKLGKTVVAFIALVVVGPLLAAAAFFLRGVVFGPQDLVVWGGTPFGRVAFGAILLLVGAGLMLIGFLARRLGATETSLGGLAVWALVSTLVTLALPGLSHLFTWPLLFAAVALLVVSSDPDAASVGWPVVATLGLGVLVTALLWAVFVDLLIAAIGPFVLAIVGLLGPWLLAGPFAGPVGLLAPARSEAAPRRLGVPSIVIAIGLLVVVAVRATTGYGPDIPKTSSLFYVLEAGDGEPSARWISTGPTLDPWASGVLGEATEVGERPAFLGLPLPAASSPAPAVDRGAATVRLLAETVDGEHRRVVLHIEWPEAPARALVLVDGDGLRAGSVDGHELAVDTGSLAEQLDGRLGFFYEKPAADGLRLEVELAVDAPLQVRPVAHYFGLPPELDVPPRPADSLPAFPWSSDSTFVDTTVTIEPGAPLDTESSDEAAVSDAPAEDPAAETSSTTEDAAS